jgi:hypothetical protein
MCKKQLWKCSALILIMVPDDCSVTSKNSLLISIHLEYGRSEFLRLNYIDSLLNMLENGDEVLQIAVLKLLRRLILYGKIV